MLKAPAGTSWQFDGFTLIPGQRLLLADGVPVPLMAKAFDTLVLLVENRGRVVSKDELLGAVWPAVVVEEGNLTQQIFLLRKALGESAQHPRYIITVPGHGYRFTGSVAEIVSADGTERAAPTAVEPQAMTPGRSKRRLITGLILAACVGGVAIAFALKRTTKSGGSAGWIDAAIRIQRLTETGRNTQTAISPDGRYVAYTESTGDQFSLYVQQIATGGKTQVVPAQSHALASLRFSPDGEFLYFAHAFLNRGAAVLSRVPAIGGPETPILEDVDSPISFSPDGRRFVFMRGAAPQTHIVVAEAGGGGQRILATRNTPLAFSFAAPSWSPDGKWVAASAIDFDAARSSIVLLPVDGGDARELYSTDHRAGAVRWLPDGSGLLTVLSETLARQFRPWRGTFSRVSGGSVWRIGYPNGGAERVTADLADYDLCCVDVTADGRMITGVLNSYVSDLWIAPSERLEAPRQITWGNPVMARHSWLPDNDTIVYRDLSGRLSGVRKDGRAFNLAVPEGYKVAGAVSACGDGRYVVFQAVPGSSIWRVTPSAGGATRITSGSLDSNPVCSHDGRSVVYSSIREGVSTVWRVPIEGGQPVQLVPGVALDALPSPSGRFLYYSAHEWNELPVRVRMQRWIVLAADGKRLFSFDVPDDMAVGTSPAWAPDESGLDYVVTRNGVSNIWRQPLAGGAPVQVTRFNASLIFDFAWSRDGQWLSVASGMNRSDVVLISRTP